MIAVNIARSAICIPMPKDPATLPVKNSDQAKESPMTVNELPTPNFVWNWFQVDRLCRKRHRPPLSNCNPIYGIEHSGAVHKPPTGYEST